MQKELEVIGDGLRESTQSWTDVPRDLKARGLIRGPLLAVDDGAQSFRETKNLRVGIGLESARIRTRERWQMLLLVALLGCFVQRLIGEAAKAAQLALKFMAPACASSNLISRISPIEPVHLIGQLFGRLCHPD